jgi:hypothetical protein
MDFVEIARFGSRLEAETIGHALDPYGIPFQVKSDDIGIFGPGAGGPTVCGASLWVPSEQMAVVAELLNCVVKPPPDEPDEPAN